MIQLIPTKISYAEIWHQWRCESDMLRYNPVTFLTIEELRAEMKNISSNLSKLHEAKEFRFFMQFQNQLVGTIAIKNINHIMGHCEIGYTVGEVFQGRGFGSKALKLLLKKIFQETSLRKIIAYVAADNLASRRIMQKSGFVQEGICREHYIINGTPTDEILYGILRSDCGLCVETSVDGCQFE